MRVVLLCGLAAVAVVGGCGHHDHYWFGKKVTWDRTGLLAANAAGDEGREPVLNVEKGVCDGTRTTGAFTLGSVGTYNGLFKVAAGGGAGKSVTFVACETVGATDYRTLRAVAVADPCRSVVRCGVRCLPDGTIATEACSGSFPEAPPGQDQPLRVVPTGQYVHKGSIGGSFLVDTVQACSARAAACLQ